MLSAITVNDVEDDPRFYPPIDDPEGGNEGEKAKTLMAVPILAVPEYETLKERMPRGIVIAINKEGSGPFTNEDADNLALYNNLIAKMFDVKTY